MVHNTSPPYAHELIGIAKQYNRTLAQTARSMLYSNNLLFLWAEAIATACFISNIIPHNSDPLKCTPHKRLFGEKPTIKHLHLFGIKAFVYIPAEAWAPGTKLLHCSKQRIFMGYSRNTKTARIYVPSRKVIVESRDVRYQSWAAFRAPPFFSVTTTTVAPAKFPTNSLPQENHSLL